MRSLFRTSTARVYVVLRDLSVVIFIVTGVFFIVGPTAVGKSRLAADVAFRLGAEILSCDAFQIYRGLDILSGKPDAATFGQVPHHLIGSIPLDEEMNAGKFRRLALPLIDSLRSNAKPVVAVGGSGLYVQSLTHGLESDWKKIIATASGILLLRDRAELYRRINERVEEMFAYGVVQEVERIDHLSHTAAKMLGLETIREHLNGRLSLPECVQRIQAATRQLAKRQLTWFRHQTKFEALNLSVLNHSEAVQWVGERARSAFAEQG